MQLEPVDSLTAEIHEAKICYAPEEFNGLAENCIARWLCLLFYLICQTVAITT